MKKRLWGIALLGCLVAIMLTGCLDYGMWYIHVKDNNDEAVEGVQIQLCDDNTCVMLTTDDIGYVDFDGEAEQYDVHILSVPDGYEYTGGDLVAKQYEELKIVLNKTGKGSNSSGNGSSSGSDSSNGSSTVNSVTYDPDDENAPTAGPGWNTEQVDDPSKYESKKNATDNGVDESENALGEDGNLDVNDDNKSGNENANATNSSKKESLKVEKSNKKITFSSKDRNGNAVDESIFADYTMTMINIWEPWCGPCRSEMPDLEELYQEYRDEGMLIIGIYSDTDGLDSVLKETGVTYPIIKSTSCFNSIVNQTQGYPTTLFVDSEGYILLPTDDELPYLESEEKDGYFVGSRDYSSWKSMIEDRME